MGDDDARHPLVIGYYGMRNAGDNAFCVVLDWALRRYWGARRCTFATPPIVDLPADRCGLDARWYRSRSVLDRTGRVVNKAALLRRSSMIVYGGGSVFRQMGPVSEKRVFSWWSSVTRHPVAAVGVSIGPFVSDAARRRLSSVLRRMEYVSVRDLASAHRLRELGFRGRLARAGDLAGLLPAALGEPIPAHRPGPAGERARLGVTLLGTDTQLGGPAALRREDVLIDAVVGLVRSQPIDVTIFEFNSHPVWGDRRPSERLRAALAGHCAVRVVGADEGVPAVWDAMKDCDAGLHMRMHGAVFAYLAGVPFALVPYQAKCDDLLAEIGQPESRRLPRIPEDGASVGAVVLNLIGSGASPALPREEFVHRAESNFTLAPWA
jgi:polysaccharide pyruvyl transferase WcaK-like protein